MRVHAIQHVEFEDSARIAEWAAQRGHALTTGMAATGEFPPVAGVDFLVVLGGPMDADDEIASPWLHAEKHYIADCIAAGRSVLGVCLGAQIIAEVLGGKVVRNPEKEIGWHAVHRTVFAVEEPLFARWPQSAVVGQWHTDTFELPSGLVPALSSEACANQAFVFDRRVVGLQFHIEWTEHTVAVLADVGRDELEAGGRLVMSPEELVAQAPDHLDANRGLLFELLDGIAAEKLAAAGDLRS